MRIVLLLFACLLASGCQPKMEMASPLEPPAVPMERTGEFDRQLTHAGTPLVIDIYCQNDVDWQSLGQEARVVGVIHKATVGTRTLDPKYAQRKAEAKARGYLWGSYHLGKAGNPEQQADYYIDTVRPEPDEVVALDLEDVTSGKYMRAGEALRFIKRVKERLGRYPAVYVNHKSAAYIAKNYKNTEFAKTPLWYARYKETVSDFPDGAWKTYALWQFSCEVNNQIMVKGVGPDADINVYNGTLEQLKKAWPLL